MRGGLGSALGILVLPLGSAKQMNMDGRSVPGTKSGEHERDAASVVLWRILVSLYLHLRLWLKLMHSIPGHKASEMSSLPRNKVKGVRATVPRALLS